LPPRQFAAGRYPGHRVRGLAGRHDRIDWDTN